MAAELGLPRWWLNEQASSYAAPGGDSTASRVFDHPGLRVFAASPEHLLAMKALAARPRDAEDIRQLVQILVCILLTTSSPRCMRLSPTRNRQHASGSS